MPTYEKYFENLSSNPHLYKLIWKLIYFFPRKKIYNHRYKVFQYKILSVERYLKKKFGKSAFPLCSFCKVKKESVIYLSNEFVKSRVMRVCVRTWSTDQCACVPTCQKRTNFLFYVATYQ